MPRKTLEVEPDGHPSRVNGDGALLPPEGWALRPPQVTSESAGHQMSTKAPEPPTPPLGGDSRIVLSKSDQVEGRSACLRVTCMGPSTQCHKPG